MKKGASGSASEEKKWKRRKRVLLRRVIERLDSMSAIDACGTLARSVFDGIECLEKFLGPDARPMYWSIDIERRVREDAFDDWDFYCDQRSSNELERWAALGGRTELVRPCNGAGLVVVRLINLEKRIACFGVSYPTRGGQRFCVIDNADVGDARALKAFLLKEEKLQLTDADDSNFEFFFIEAPCQLVKPPTTLRRRE